MSPVTVTLLVPYVESEQQFLMHAVQVALKVFRETRFQKTGDLHGTASVATTMGSTSARCDDGGGTRPEQMVSAAVL